MASEQCGRGVALVGEGTASRPGQVVRCLVSAIVREGAGATLAVGASRPETGRLIPRGPCMSPPCPSLGCASAS